MEKNTIIQKELRPYEIFIKKEKETFYKKLNNHRKSRKEFNNLILEIDSKVKKLISSKSKPSVIKIKVTAIPLTENEKTYITTYLNYEYLSYALGTHFIIRKCLFSNRYCLKSISVWDYEYLF